MSELTVAMEGVEIKGELKTGYEEILTPDAVAFVVKLHRAFNGRRAELLAARQVRQTEIDNGKFPDFLPETAHIRESEWTVAPLPEDLLDRRVEITGPVDRKMVINALNSGAKMFMADFEDRTALLGTTTLVDRLTFVMQTKEPSHLKIQQTERNMR